MFVAPPTTLSTFISCFVCHFKKALAKNHAENNIRAKYTAMEIGRAIVRESEEEGVR